MRIVHAIAALTMATLIGCTDIRRVDSSHLNEQGVQYLTTNDLPKAHAKFVEAWKHDPKNADTLYNLASTYHRKGQMQEAERYYREALQINPHLEACRHNYYMLLVSENRIPEARNDAERWLAQNKNSANAYSELGWLMRMQGDLPNARKNLEQALTLEPHNTEALLETGKLYQDFNLNDRAKGLYQRVLQQDPLNQEAKALLTALPKK